MKRLILLATAAFAASVFGGELWAQQTSTGAFGERTTGGTTGTSAPRNNTGSSTGGTSGGSGGNTSITASTGEMSMLREVSGQADSSARYVRGNRTSADFVGADSGEARAVGVVQADGAGGGGRGGAGGAQSFTSLFSSGGGRNGNVLSQLMSGQFNQGGNQRTRSSAGGAAALRIPIRMDFSSTPIATSRFTGQFQKRLGKLPGLSTVGPIEILVEGETVVLRGVVASEGDRQLAEDLAKLEPEVGKVRNELTVQGEAGSSAAAQPAPTTVTP
jgi:hypothetical protein